MAASPIFLSRRSETGHECVNLNERRLANSIDLKGFCVLLTMLAGHSQQRCIVVINRFCYWASVSYFSFSYCSKVKSWKRAVRRISHSCNMLWTVHPFGLGDHFLLKVSKSELGALIQWTPLLSGRGQRYYRSLQILSHFIGQNSKPFYEVITDNYLFKVFCSIPFSDLLLNSYNIFFKK